MAACSRNAAAKPRYFDSLDADQRKRIADAPLTFYVYEGEPSEIQEWFETINIAGVPLVKQELRNAAYHGPFVTIARGVFSNTSDSNMNRWKVYIKGDPKRQAILETALNWASRGDIDGYMAAHRYDRSIDMLKNRFDTIVDWVDSVFEYTGKGMCGQEWGRPYEAYGKNPYSKAKVSERFEALMEDEQVGNKRGIIEYVLGVAAEQQTRRAVKCSAKRTTAPKATANRQSLARDAGGGTSPEGVSPCILLITLKLGTKSISK